MNSLLCLILRMLFISFNSVVRRVGVCGRLQHFSLLSWIIIPKGMSELPASPVGLVV